MRTARGVNLTSKGNGGVQDVNGDGCTYLRDICESPASDSISAFSFSSTAVSAVQPLIPVLRDSQRPIAVGTLARAPAPAAIHVLLPATRVRVLPVR